MGRPTVCTAEMIEAVCAALQAAPVSIACAAEQAGICESTYHSWRERGRSGEEPYATFLERTTRAVRATEAMLVEDIANARTGPDKPDWKARAWILERRFRDEWGKTDRVAVQHDVTDGAADKLGAAFKALSSLSASELLAYRRQREQQDDEE